MLGWFIGTALAVQTQMMPEPDTDADGLTDAEELVLGSDPTDPDTDGDGLLDGAEVALGTQPLDADSDEDGLADGLEVLTDPLNPDTDGDGIQDGTELGQMAPLLLGISDGGVFFEGTDTGVFVPDRDIFSTTDPLDTDSDGDGIEDGVEDVNRNGRRDGMIGETGFLGSGETDAALADTDQDGLEDGEEIALGTSATDTDTDNGGVTDGVEVQEDGTDPLDASDDLIRTDVDFDGLSDLDERELGTDLLDPDSDDDGLLDGMEVHEYQTDPLNPDTDAGGVEDGEEVAFRQDPLDPTDDFSKAEGAYQGGCSSSPGINSLQTALFWLHRRR